VGLLNFSCKFDPTLAAAEEREYDPA